MTSRQILLFSTGLCLAAAVSSHGQAPSLRPATPSANLPLANTRALPETNSTLRGGELARQYCGVCHAFPNPSLLTKREWAHHVLPQMAQWLGIEPTNYEGEKDGQLLQEAGVFPSSPILPEQDWFAIWDYYVSSAPSRQLPPPARPKTTAALKNFRARKLNFHKGAPAISLVKIDSTQKRLFVGDQFAGLLAVVDPAGPILGSARLENTPVGLAEHTNGNYVTLIGRMFPSDALEGSVIFVPKGAGNSVPTVLEKLRRPTHTAVGDLNQDGRPDLVVCQFGHRLGQFSWFEAKANGQFEEHILLKQPGATRSELHDLNRDGKLDIVVLTAQAREAIYIFYNLGGGRFRQEIAVEQPPAFGYAGFQMVDFNRDGFLDILAANGDNGDYPTPHKPYHGLRIHLNDGTNRFHEAWFYPMEGAYNASAADFDGDGDLDIGAISFFPDFQKEPVEGFVYLENQGGFQFAPRTLPEADAGRWMTMDAGDMDGDGDMDMVLGSFTTGPTTIPIPAALRENWKTNGAAVLVLENLLR